MPCDLWRWETAPCLVAETRWLVAAGRRVQGRSLTCSPCECGSWERWTQRLQEGGTRHCV